MPGGRGKLTEVALSLNNEKHTEVAHAIKMALDHNNYVINASVDQLGIAYTNCKHTDSLTDVWCHAVETGKIIWEY